MADTHETITDIIAEMRKDKGVDPNLMWDNSQVEEHDLHYADRLEAANKRERGDCAKLREALVSLRDAVRDFRHQTVYTKYNDIMDEYTCREKGIPAVLALRNAIPKANLALAAPPRNCDKYANYKDAMKAFEAFVREQGKLGFINPYTEAFKWLFAPATEQEGGAK